MALGEFYKPEENHF